MALNPFFLQGSSNEQRLIQDIINEHLKIFGVEIVYIPRKFVRREKILEEITSSKFNDNFSIEAYIVNYDGYSGQGDILSKFGVSLKDEVNLVISRETYENFISPFLSQYDDQNELITRPKEGDLIYFPLGQRLFEVKFVEHESSFYQLGKLYVYELKCELFEYEDEVINTTIDEIDTQLQDEGYITTLQLIGAGSTATVSPTISTGYIREIFLNNDGYGYTSPPIVSISSAPAGGVNATAVATIKNRSLESIVLTNAGAGYTVRPFISFSGGGGTGAAATCSIETNFKGVSNFTITNFGSGYVNSVPITISGSVGIGETATATAIVGSGGTIIYTKITNPGLGYTITPNAIVSPPPLLSGTGNYLFNEEVIGESSNTVGRVKFWDKDTKMLKVSFVNNVSTNKFYPGELVIGSLSGAKYSVKYYEDWNQYDKYSENVEIEKESDSIIDFSESNPFGTY